MLWNQVFETLTGYRGSDPTPRPALAVALTTEDDGSTWRLRIAAGHRFHDGTEVTAAAVCDNFDHWNGAERDRGDRMSAWPYWFQGFGSDSSFVGCEASGAWVRLEFASPYPELPAILTDPAFSIRSPGSFDGDIPVGSGPYRWVTGDLVRVDLAAVGDEGPRTVRLEKLGVESAPGALADRTVGLFLGATAFDTPPAGVRAMSAGATSQVVLVANGAKGALADTGAREQLMAAIGRADLAAAVDSPPATGVLPGIFAPPPLTGPSAPATVPDIRRELRVVTADWFLDPVVQQGLVDHLTSRLARNGVTLQEWAVADPDALQQTGREGTASLAFMVLAKQNGDLADYAAWFHSDNTLGSWMPRALAARVDRGIEAVGSGADGDERRTAALAVLDLLVREHLLLPVVDITDTWWLGPRIAAFEPVAFQRVDLSGVRLR